MDVCEICKTNPATIHLHMQINYQTRNLNLCSTCYKKVRRQMMNSNSPLSGLPFGIEGGPVNDLFQSFMDSANSKGNHFTPEGENPQIMTQTPAGSRDGLLEQLGRNLTAAAREGKVDPVIGRDKEIERVIEILNRRNKNNPVLIGEPGVGKTAVAEGLAQRIVQGKVPQKLQHKQLFVLDVASLVANTSFRGQFEERMKQLLAELQQRQDAILFIDEVHLLVGAGSAQGSMDAGNILKPALARGDIQVIGATTLKEYRQIEKDAALERRLQPVLVDEPGIDETVQILKGLKEKYEQYHQVVYSDEALKACATLSHRYIQDRYLPDKAIDLMDEAGSRVNLSESNQTSDTLEARLSQIRKEKKLATKEEQYERAAQLRDEEKHLIRQLKENREAAAAKVNLADIQAIIEDKTGIPVQKLQQDEQTKMRNLEERLNGKVIGQPNAVSKVARAIRRSRAGLKNSQRPIGSFLFVGPTGVGKTELAKVLAEELFGDRDAIIRLDMSEYMEKHSISKLIGSPPGYVGYEEAGQLTEQVRRKPYSIVLLDEIEKAHPDVQHIFLQILEDGRLTDSQGRTISFKDTVVIMTSNAGTAERKVRVGFGNDQMETQSVLNSLSAYFKPEFLNRLDAAIEFNSLSRENMLQILAIMLQEVSRQLKEQGITVEFTVAAQNRLAELGYSPQFGARPLRRVIQEQVEDKIADVLLENDTINHLTIDTDGDKITVQTASPAQG